MFGPSSMRNETRNRSGNERRKMSGQKLFLKQRAWYEGDKYKNQRRTVGPKGTRETKVTRNARAYFYYSQVSGTNHY